MFSQLTALAKSATDFSLDNLQQEQEEREQDTNNNNENNKNENEEQEQEQEEEKYKNESLQQYTSITSSTSASTKHSSSSSSFTGLFSSANEEPPVSSESSKSRTTTSSTVTNTFNQFFDSFKSNDASDKEAVTVTSPHNKSTTHSNQKSSQQTQSAVTPDNFKQQKQKLSPSPPHTEENINEDAKTSPKKASKSTKPKKGSGREAAKLLEMQLRGTISDLERALNEKSDQLDQMKSGFDKESHEKNELQTKLLSLEATISAVRESQNDVVNEKKALESEVECLRRDTLMHLQKQQELHHQLNRAMEKGSGGASSEPSVNENKAETMHKTRLREAEAEVLRLQESLKTQLQALDDETRKHTGMISTVNAKLLSSQEQNQVLVEEVKSLKSAVESQRDGFEEERSRFRKELLEKDQRYDADQKSWEEIKSILDSNIIALNEENLSLQSALQERMQLNEESDRDHLASEAETQGKIATLQENLRQSEAKYTELKDKFSAFAEKTKAQVKKFIEAQKVSEEEKVLAAQALEARDSEITSLRLKLNSIDNSLSDREALSTELSEK